jgi:hypothetical protein
VAKKKAKKKYGKPTWAKVARLGTAYYSSHDASEAREMSAFKRLYGKPFESFINNYGEPIPGMTHPPTQRDAEEWGLKATQATTRKKATRKKKKAKRKSPPSKALVRYMYPGLDDVGLKVVAAKYALQAYAEQTGQLGRSHRHVLMGLLTDLMHWSDVVKVDMGEVCMKAKKLYEKDLG